MARIIGVLTLALMILLFPPATLALISNNAIPGDATYPIKRILEAGILKMLSVNPTTVAWFTVKRSERRFAEATTLLSAGKRDQTVRVTLNELVGHTDQAAKEIAKVDDPGRKKQLVNELKQSINKYQVRLEAEKEKIKTEQYQTPTGQPSPSVTPEPTPTSQPVYSTPSTGLPSPTPTPRVTPLSTPRITPSPSIRPTDSPRVSSSPSRAPSPSPQPSPTPPAYPYPTPPVTIIDCEDPDFVNFIDCINQRLGRTGGSLPAGDPGIGVQNVHESTIILTPTLTETPSPIPSPSAEFTVGSIDCSACQADVINTGGGQVDSYDMAALNSCARHAAYAQTPVYGSACKKMDKNENGKIDQEELNCAQDKFGQICAP